MALVAKKPVQSNSIDQQWCDYKDAEGNVLASLLIRGNGHRPYQLAVDRINRHGMKIDQLMQNGLSKDALSVSGESLSEFEAHSLVIAQHLIVGWRGIVDEEGNDHPFSVENADQLLQQNSGLFLWVIQEAKRIQNGSDEKVAETVGKPQPDTNTSSTEKPQKKRK